jgi:hypothetical protein
VWRGVRVRRRVGAVPGVDEDAAAAQAVETDLAGLVLEALATFGATLGSGAASSRIVTDAGDCHAHGHRRR